MQAWEVTHDRKKLRGARDFARKCQNKKKPLAVLEIMSSKQA